MKKTPNPEAFARVVGVDVGYGDLKASNSEVQIHIPSIIGAAPTMHYADEWSRDDGETITDDQGVWFVGEKALLHSKNIRYIKDRGRTWLPDYRRLFYVALARLHPQVDDSRIETVNVVTGLPVRHMADKEALVQLLSGQHRVRTSKSDGVYHIDHVGVMPQPYGTLCYNVLDEYGTLVEDNLSRARVLIVDVGRFTTNIITTDSMAYMERASDSIDSGVHVIESHLLKYLEREHNWPDARPDFVQGIILSDDHKCRIDGKMEDLSDPFQAGVNDLSEQIVGMIGELVGQGHDIDYLIATGGGGLLLMDSLKEHYDRVYLTENPVMANAIGFARYGRRQWA